MGAAASSRHQPWNSAMDLAAAITQKDKTSATEGRIRQELKRELATARSYSILKKNLEEKKRSPEKLSLYISIR